MREALATDPAATRLMADRSPPLSSICREVGLAAFAAELHLRASELELDAAVAVERGAAALFLAGFWRQPTISPPHGRIGRPRPGLKMRRSSTSSRRSRRLRLEKGLP